MINDQYCKPWPQGGFSVNIDEKDISKEPDDKFKQLLKTFKKKYGKLESKYVGKKIGSKRRYDEIDLCSSSDEVKPHYNKRRKIGGGGKVQHV